MEYSGTEADDAHREDDHPEIAGKGKQEESGQCEAHAQREGIRPRMTVSIEPGEGLQDG